MHRLLHPLKPLCCAVLCCAVLSRCRSTLTLPFLHLPARPRLHHQARIKAAVEVIAARNPSWPRARCWHTLFAKYCELWQQQHGLIGLWAAPQGGAWLGCVRAGGLLTVLRPPSPAERLGQASTPAGLKDVLQVCVYVCCSRREMRGVRGRTGVLLAGLLLWGCALTPSWHLLSPMLPRHLLPCTRPPCQAVSSTSSASGISGGAPAVAKVRLCLDAIAAVLGQPALRVMTQLVMAGAWRSRQARGLWASQRGMFVWLRGEGAGGSAGHCC
jgi:hypothetical protein